jgi:hypothetical protein
MRREAVALRYENTYLDILGPKLRYSSAKLHTLSGVAGSVECI